MSPTYLRRRREMLRKRAMAGVAARERKRQARNAECDGWRRVRSLLLVVRASPDGRHLAMQVHGVKTWERCGTERAVRAALARMLWRAK